MSKPTIWNPETMEADVVAYITGGANLKSSPPLTIELLKTFPGCENYTDEEAAFKLKCFDVIVPIMRDLKPVGKIISIDNQQVVNCVNENGQQKLAA